MIRNRCLLLIALASAAFMPACAELDDDAPPTVVYFPQNVTYNYYYGVTSSASAAACYAAPPVAPTAMPLTSGFPICDRLLETSQKCIDSLTTNAAARARFERAIDGVRSSDWAVAQSGTAESRAQVAEKCQAALSAYEQVPCGGA